MVILTPTLTWSLDFAAPGLDPAGACWQLVVSLVGVIVDDTGPGSARNVGIARCGGDARGRGRILDVSGTARSFQMGRASDEARDLPADGDCCITSASGKCLRPVRGQGQSRCRISTARGPGGEDQIGSGIPAEEGLHLTAPRPAAQPSPLDLSVDAAAYLWSFSRSKLGALLEQDNTGPSRSGGPRSRWLSHPRIFEIA
jgi:hypothetical protein